MLCAGALCSLSSIAHNQLVFVNPREIGTAGVAKSPRVAARRLCSGLLGGRLPRRDLLPVNSSLTVVTSGVAGVAVRRARHGCLRAAAWLRCSGCWTAPATPRCSRWRSPPWRVHVPPVCFSQPSHMTNLGAVQLLLAFGPSMCQHFMSRAGTLLVAQMRLNNMHGYIGESWALGIAYTVISLTSRMLVAALPGSRCQQERSC